MIVGIDNGLTGAIVILTREGEIFDTILMPVETGPSSRGRATNIIAARKLVKILKNPLIGPNIAVEKPGGAHDYNAAVSMADSFATLRTVVLALGKTLHAVTSGDWQREFWPTPPRTPKGQERPAKYDPKYLAAIAARKVWPGTVFLASPQSTTSHKGIVDAALIAEFLRRKIYLTPPTDLFNP